MIIHLIVLVFLFVGLIGMGVIIYQKLPALNSLPAEKSKIKWEEILSSLQNSTLIKKLSSELNIFLQKLLSRVKILTLKTENWLSNQLKKLKKNNKN